MHIYIITGGRIETDFALSYMKKHKPDCIIAVDSGLNFCHKVDLMPDYIFGDFDSVETSVYAYYKERIPESIHKFSTRKDETDTELAMREAVKLIEEIDTVLLMAQELSIHDENMTAALERIADFDPKNNITILGGTGTRLDHIFGNLHLLKIALEARIDCQIVDPYNRIRMLDQYFSFAEEEPFGDYVSLLPFTPVVEGLTLKGFEYPLEDFTMESGIARGVSNEIIDEDAEVFLKSGILLMFETRD